MFRPTDPQFYSIFRDPSWRFIRIRELLEHGSVMRPSPHEDKLIIEGRSFLHRYRKEGTEKRSLGLRRLYNRYPALYLAYEMYARSVELRNGHPTVEHMEACLLAGMSDQETADVVQTLPEAIRYYEALFFNVRDRLTAPDWVVNNVIAPAYIKSWLPPIKRRGDDGRDRIIKLAIPFNDATMKLFAYFGGAHALAALHQSWMTQGKLRTPDELGRWLDNGMALAIKGRSNQASLTAEVNRYSFGDLANAHIRIRELESGTGGGSSLERQESVAKAILNELPFRTWTDDAKLPNRVVKALPAAERRDLSFVGNENDIEYLAKMPAPTKRNPGKAIEKTPG